MTHVEVRICYQLIEHLQALVYMYSFLIKYSILEKTIFQNFIQNGWILFDQICFERKLENNHGL